jgi:O-antigen ligase
VERWLRAYGSLDHPNILGGFLTMGFSVIIFYLIIKSKKITFSQKDDFRRKIFEINILFYPIMLLVIIGIFFSFSRASWLATSVLIFLLVSISIITKNKLFQKHFLPILLYGGIVVFLISIPFSNLIEARLKGQGRLEYISKIERIQSVNSAKDILTDNWLFGTGIGNYTINFKNNYVPSEKSYYYQPTHNTFLLIWSELGIFGLFSFLFFLIFIFFEGLDRNTLIYKIPWFTALFVLLFFDHWWWSLHFGVFYFWLVCGFSLVLFRLDNDKQNMV